MKRRRRLLKLVSKEREEQKVRSERLTWDWELVEELDCPLGKTLASSTLAEELDCRSATGLAAELDCTSAME